MVFLGKHHHIMRPFLLFFIFTLFSCSKTTGLDIYEIARRGSVSEMETILKQNTSLINKKNKSGFTPLILASYNNNKNIVSFLINKKANLNELSDMGTALMAAAYKGNNEISKALINNGANVNSTDTNNTSALHYACFFQNKELVKLLINKKAKINGKDNKGKTPLDYAIGHNNIELIKILQQITN